jgi:hypothetical protein
MIPGFNAVASVYRSRNTYLSAREESRGWSGCELTTAANCGQGYAWCNDSKRCVLVDCPPHARLLPGGPCAGGCQCDKALCPPGQTLSSNASVDNGCPCVSLNCPAGYVDCGGNCVSLNTVQHCGSCGKWCPSGASCVDGNCVCPPNQVPCGANCNDLGSDPQNCGQCGNSCAEGATCIGGQCLCPPNQTVCGGVCTDVNSDLQNCGQCGNVCDGADTCVNGNCVSPCDSCHNCHADWFLGICRCNGRTCLFSSCCCPDPNETNCFFSGCTNTMTDSNNCGRCLFVCAPGETCVNGICECTDPSKGCGTSTKPTTGSLTVQKQSGAYSNPSYQCTGGGSITISSGSKAQTLSYAYSGYSSILPNQPACSASPVTFNNLQPGTWTVKWTDDGVAIRTSCPVSVSAGQNANLVITDDVCT